jgi:hypothetical protein
MTVRGKVIGLDITVGGKGVGTGYGGIPRSGGGPGFLALKTNGMRVGTGCADFTEGHVYEGGDGMNSGG